jgi:dCTP deaminase
MILTDREIEIFIANKQITIDPEPPLDAYSSTSLDLTLAEPGEIWKRLPGEPIRPNAMGYQYRQLAARREKVSLDGFTFKSNSLLLAWTRESVSLPYTSRIAARVEGKSGLARLGLVIHMTAPTIHAGFRGQIQLEMCNLGPYDIILDVGMPICQLIFEITFGTAAKGYTGQFAGQSARS